VGGEKKRKEKEGDLEDLRSTSCQFRLSAEGEINFLGGGGGGKGKKNWAMQAQRKGGGAK